MPTDAFGFARTKVQPPRLRPGQAPRPALVARLADGLAHARLTLVSAAGGYGKSSAIAQALAQAGDGLHAAWIGCDEDDTLARFCACLVVALEPFDPPWRLSPEALIAGLERADGVRAFRDALVNALAATELPRGVIVLDDLHRVGDARLHEFLAGLPASLPQHWGLALVTRVDPPWSLARLRATDALVEIRQDELRFGLNEIGALASQAGRGREAALALLARTEGWPVGVTLALAGSAGAAAGLPGAAPMRSERHAIDYLRSEVLDGLPADLRRFLVASSVLPALTAARAAAVTGRADADVCLDEIERRGLFFQPVDSAERTLRLHDIFREALAAERAALPQAERSALWRRAADSEPDVARRFDYALAADDPALAVQTLTQAGPMLIAAGLLDTVHAMLDKLPERVRAESAEIALMRGIIAWEAMDLEAMAALMKQAAAGFAARGDAGNRDLARAYVALAINGMSPIGNPRSDPDYEVQPDASTPPRTRVFVALHRGWHAFDLADFEATNRHYGEAFDQLVRLPPEEAPALWYQLAPGMAYFGVRALAPLLQRFADGALRVADDDYPVLRAMALAVRGGERLWRGELAQARADLDESVSLAAWINFPHTLSVYALNSRLLCRAVQGELDAALAEFHAALPRVVDTLGPDGRGPGWYFHWFELRCCLMAEADERARAALASLRRTMPPGLTSTHTGAVRIIDAYDAVLSGDAARAAALMHESLAHYGDNDALGIVTALNLQRAGLLLELGDEAGAGAALARGLESIHLRSTPMSALFAGRGALRRLAESRVARGLDAVQRGVLDGILAGLPERRAASATSAASTAPAAAPAPSSSGGATPITIATSATDEPISPREADVLDLLAAGESNKVIARRLGLSPHTVKRHVANILAKLAVESRGQAAAWYRARA